MIGRIAAEIERTQFGSPDIENTVGTPRDLLLIDENQVYNDIKSQRHHCQIVVFYF